MRCLSCLLLLGLTVPILAAEETAEALIHTGRLALRRDNFAQAKEAGTKALALAEKAVARNPKDAGAFLLRGGAHEVLGEHKKAVADFTQALKLKPKLAAAYELRGSERFKLGQIAGSVADFDRYLALRPAAAPGHWKRGISLYYAGRFDEGRKQFKGYEKVDTNDVENAVWHFLCAARKDGVAKARTSLLKIGKDTRQPMMEVYALFAGKAKPEDVLKAAGKRNNPLFYAHLYLGLYFEATGDRKRTLKHLSEATDKYRIGHYMWDVARVARNTLLRSSTKN